MKLYETLQTKNKGYIQARSIRPVGIFVHSTGASNPELRRYVDAPELLGKNLYDNHWNKGTATKSMHAFIGLDKNKEVAVCHTLPYNIACWGAGGGSKGSYNYDPQAHIQFEVCEDNAPRSGNPPTAEQTEYFKKAWLAAEEYCAYLCKLLKLPASSIVGHYEAAKLGYASYHSDPENWLRVYGDSMDKFRARVAKRLQGEVVQPEPKPDPKPEPQPESEQPKITLPATIKLQITKPENAKFFGKPIGTIISLPTEEYIKGVVPAEVGNPPLEAGIAQAIVARSLALSGRWPDVISDTTSHQAYSGERSADPDYFRAHQAVKDSKGIVLLYKGKIASTFYADSNGGKMVASDMHWNQKTPYEQREHIPYLVSKDDPWTLASGKPFNGHPVGMSQQGAIWAAKNGIKHEEILAFYYPGTVLSSKVATTPGTPPVTPPDSKDYLYRAMVVTANPLSLNIWSNTKKGSSLKKVPKGAFVEVLKEVNSTWAQVRYNGTIGYSDRQYLKPHNETGTYLATVVTMYPLSLNIWAAANKGKSLGKVPKGAVVTVLGEVDSTWAKVQYGNIIGYSDRKYLKRV